MAARYLTSVSRRDEMRNDCSREVTTSGMMHALINSPFDPVMYGAPIFMTGILLGIGFSACMTYPTQFVSKEKSPSASAVVNMGGQLGGRPLKF